MVLGTLRRFLRTPPPNTRHVRTLLLGGVLVTQPTRSCAPAPSTHSSISLCARVHPRAHILARAHPRVHASSRAQHIAACPQLRPKSTAGPLRFRHRVQTRSSHAPHARSMHMHARPAPTLALRPRSRSVYPLASPTRNRHGHEGQSQCREQDAEDKMHEMKGHDNDDRDNDAHTYMLMICQLMIDM